MALFVIFLGAPGAGKGTQAKMTAERLMLSHISTGDLLRDAVSKKTVLGKEAKEYMDKGQLVPDSLIMNLISEKLGNGDSKKGFLFDGFPRTMEQAKGLDKLLTETNKKLTHVISIDVDESSLLNRLTGRRTCEKCGQMYHVMFNKSKIDGICDKCGSKLYQRKDDKEETIINRIKVFHDQTDPLINYYGSKDILFNIDGNNEVNKVFDTIVHVIAQ